MKDSDIDLSDLPEVTPEMFARAVVRRGLKAIKSSKVQLTVRLDRDVLDWYRPRERYQSSTSRSSRTVSCTLLDLIALRPRRTTARANISGVTSGRSDRSMSLSFI